MSDDREILRRLELLEEERAIVRTLYRYGHSIDYGLHDEWVDCFTDDGVFDLRLRVLGTARRVCGAEELAAFIHDHSSAPDRYHKHLLVDPVVSLDGERATVESYFARIDADDGGEPFLFSFGRYHDRMRKCSDGIWRFEERIAESEARDHRAR